MMKFSDAIRRLSAVGQKYGTFGSSLDHLLEVKSVIKYLYSTAASSLLLINGPHSPLPCGPSCRKGSLVEQTHSVHKPTLECLVFNEVLCFLSFIAFVSS